MKRTALYLLLALLSAWPLQAQSSAAAPASGMQIRFGQAMIPLTGPWKFHTGDDMRWADPKFDDASWGTVDLTPNAVNPNTGLSGFASGWTMRGCFRDGSAGRCRSIVRRKPRRRSGGL